jgi:hypothetical protein
MQIIADGIDCTSNPPHWFKDAQRVIGESSVDVRALSFTKDRRGPIFHPRGDVTMNTIVGHGVEIYWVDDNGDRSFKRQVLTADEVVLIEEIVIQTVLHFADLDWIEIRPKPEDDEERERRRKVYESIATNEPGLG